MTDTTDNTFEQPGGPEETPVETSESAVDQDNPQEDTPAVETTAEATSKTVEPESYPPAPEPDDVPAPPDEPKTSASEPDSIATPVPDTPPPGAVSGQTAALSDMPGGLPDHFDALDDDEDDDYLTPPPGGMQQGYPGGYAPVEQIPQQPYGQNPGLNPSQDPYGLQQQDWQEQQDLHFSEQDASHQAFNQGLQGEPGAPPPPEMAGQPGDANDPGQIPPEQIPPTGQASRDGDGGGEPPRSHTGDLDALPVSVDFMVGQAEMTVADLKKLAQGYTVLDLANVSFPKVKACSAGRAFAEGELVEVDGRIGFRVTKILP